MNERKLAAIAATIVLVVLPVMDFLQHGRVSDTLIAPLVLLAFGGGGYAADRAVKARIQEWVGDRRQGGKGHGRKKR